MDETVYTIPINDALDQSEKCPLCYLEEAYEEDLLRYYLGPALMAPDIRIQTNKNGFCQTHFYRLYNSGLNRLGLALILQTHLQERRSDMTKTLEKLLSLSSKNNIFSKSSNQEARLLNDISNHDTCLYCRSLEEHMNQYFHSLVYIYKNDLSFQKKMENCKFLCLPHAAQLCIHAGKQLNTSMRKQFLSALSKILHNEFTELKNDLQGYVDKHDYRNKSADWGTSKEASLKTIALLLGEEKGHES